MQNPGTPGPEGQQASIAQKLGLPESVNVLRTSGAIEGGWRPTEITHAAHPQTGEPTTFVRVDAFDADGKGMYKRIPLGDLHSWNIQDADDTVPSSSLQHSDNSEPGTPQSVPSRQIAREFSEVLLPGEVPKQVAEEVGEVAVEESGVIEPLEPDQNNNDQQPDTDHVKVASVAEQSRPNPEAAMRELAELWGMPESMTTEQAVLRLEAEGQELEQMSNLLHTFDGTRHMAAKGLLDTLQGSGIVYVGNATKAQVDEFLLGRSFATIHGFAALDKQTLLPTRIRNDIAHFQADFKRLQATWNHATEGFRSGRPSINAEPAQQAANLLNRSVPDLQKTLLTASRQVKAKIAELGGHVTLEGVEEQVEKVVYRNPEWAQRAEKLKEAPIDDPELETFVQDIEGAIRIETGMIDDPNSPRKWFSHRVLNNIDKERQNPSASGRRKAIIPSQRQVAEIAADILRGNFDYEIAKLDPIDLSPNGKEVYLGQHRAAALAMIYGADRWVDEGRKLGMRIEKRK